MHLRAAGLRRWLTATLLLTLLLPASVPAQAAVRPLASTALAGPVSAPTAQAPSDPLPSNPVPKPKVPPQLPRAHAALPPALRALTTGARAAPATDGGSPTAPSAALQGASASTITLATTIRDMQKAHPDFDDGVQAQAGLVQATLGADDTPVLANPSSGNGAITSAASFAQWFHDAPGVNQRLPWSLVLAETAAGSGTYTYQSASFFPIDGQGFGNEGSSHNHNFNFTLELHATFRYQGGETFTFTGDDDIWVFINKQLRVDLGGIHGSKTGSVSLNTLGLTLGQNYTFDFFFAERHCCASVFKFTTSIQLTPAVKGLDPRGTRTPEPDCPLCPAPNAPPVPAQINTARPINTRTGNYWTRTTDLQVETPGAPLVWQRTYASQAITDTLGTLGSGWQHPYAAKISTPSMAGGEAGKAILITGAGNRLTFTDAGGGQYQTPRETYSTLASGNGVFTQTLTTQERRIFDGTTGRLTAVLDPQGRRLSMTSNGSGQLTDLVDAADSSRLLHLTYDGAGRITNVRDNSTPPRSVTYRYDANGDKCQLQM